MTQTIQSFIGTECSFDGFDPEETYWISDDTASFQTREFFLIHQLVGLTAKATVADSSMNLLVYCNIKDSAGERPRTTWSAARQHIFHRGLTSEEGLGKTAL